MAQSQTPPVKRTCVNRLFSVEGFIFTSVISIITLIIVITRTKAIDMIFHSNVSTMLIKGVGFRASYDDDLVECGRPLRGEQGDCIDIAAYWDSDYILMAHILHQFTGNVHQSNKTCKNVIIVVGNPMANLLKSEGEDPTRKQLKWEGFYKKLLSEKKTFKLILFSDELRMDVMSLFRQICDFLKMKKLCSEETLSCIAKTCRTHPSIRNYARKDQSVVPVNSELIPSVKIVYKLVELCVRKFTCVRYFSVWPIGFFNF